MGIYFPRLTEILSFRRDKRRTASISKLKILFLLPKENYGVLKLAYISLNIFQMAADKWIPESKVFHYILDCQPL